MRVVPVVLLAVLLVGCDSFKSLSDVEYINNARDYLDKGEPGAASIELKNALSENPENTEARWLLGEVYLDLGNMASAEKELKMARDLGVSDESVLPLLAKSYLYQGKYDDLQELLRVQSSLSKESQSSLLASQGLAFLGEGEFDKADDSLESAIRISPDYPYALYGQAAVSFARRDYDEAQRILQRALDLDPVFSEAWGLSGDLDRRMNNLESAEDAYSKAIDSGFNDSSHRFKRAMVRIQLQKFDDAQKDINKLKRQAPGSASVNYAQGFLDFSQGNFSKAQESLELALRANENYMPAVFYLGATHFSLRNGQQAERYLSRYLMVNPDYMPARKLLAVQESSLGNYQRVEELVVPVLNKNKDDVIALNLLASSYIAQGRTKDGAELLNRVSELQPESASAKTRLGVGLLLQGEQPNAVANLESAIDLDPEFEQANLLLIANHLRNKEYDKARQAAEEYISRSPDNPAAYNLLGLIYVEQDQIASARESFTKALEVSPGYPPASQNLAALALRDSKPDEARKIYQKALDEHENHLDILLKLAVLEAGQGNEGAMRGALLKAVNAHPQAAQPRVYLARNYLQSGDIKKAQEVLGDLGEKYPESAEILGIMGEIQLVKKDYSNAKTTYMRVTKLAPASAEAHYKLALVYAGLDKPQEAEEQLVRTLQLAPEHFPALLALTGLQVRGGHLEEAENNLALLKARGAAGDPQVLAIEAALRSESGDKIQALALLKERFKANATSNSLLQLVRAKWDLGLHKEAVGDLETWLASQPSDVDVRIALAKLYAAQGNNAGAIEQYKEVLEISGTNLLALNNLAWYLRETQPERALAYAEKANSIKPESPVIMDTLAELFLAKGELARAERFNSRTLEADPYSPTFLYRRAKILEATNKQDDAILLLFKILENEQEFPERKEAEKMLARLSG